MTMTPDAPFGSTITQLPPLTLFANASKGGKKRWSISIDPESPDTVTVEWGIVGGTLQRSSDVAKPKGRIGTKSYKTAETVARDNYDRQVRKKREEGYLAAGETAAVADYLKALDKNFVPAKPVQSATQEELEALDATGKLWIQRKRDGRRHLVLVTNEVPSRVRIYSRRMEELTDHLPSVCHGIRNLMLPHGTILDGEIIVVNPDGSDNFRACGEFTNPATNPAKAAARAAEYDVRYMVFDVLYHAGKPVWQLPYDERYRLALKNLTRNPNKPVHLAEVINYRDDQLETFNPSLRAPLAQLQMLAVREKWEGLILWERDKASVVRMGGKPKRVNATKWKPKLDKDVIATGYYLGSGEWSDVVGGFFLAEIDPTTGAQRDAGKCGTGFDADERTEALGWTYPCVIAIQCDYQEPESGKFRFPVFKKKHEDKTPDECIGIELDGAE